MPQVPTRVFSKRFAAAGAAAIIVLISSADAQVVTIVEGQPITEQDIRQRARLEEWGAHKTPTRQDIIEELSDEIEEISQARGHGIAPSEVEVNSTFKNIAIRMGIDSRKLADILTSGGASAATLKERLRAQIAKSSLEGRGFDPHGIRN